MEIKIGIVENERKYIDLLVEFLYKWANENLCSIQFETFANGEDILNRSVFDYHVLFVDIQLGGINGVEVAKALRHKSYSGEIVFITVYHEYVFDGYEVQALNYIMKPIPYDKLKNCMDVVKKVFHNEYYILQNRDLIEKISYRDIIYISSARHYMELITQTSSYRHLISIKDMMKHLPSQFIQCHRTLIINIYYVQKLEGHNVIMRNKANLPVSNTYLQNVRKKLESLVF